MQARSTQTADVIIVIFKIISDKHLIVPTTNFNTIYLSAQWCSGNNPAYYAGGQVPSSNLTTSATHLPV